MATAIDEICKDALGLSPEERLALAYRLPFSVESDPGELDIDAAWDAEISMRIAAYDAGETKSISAAEVFARACPA
ncbi:MAG TPA: addiction module protein [Candidatus Saccharimonadia bacterium]|nr:addiction module protein [Candidatus Saccharimonadia bacterium]